MHAKIKYTEFLRILSLMYAKKFTNFCQVLNKIQTKENWFLFSASRRTDTATHIMVIYP